MLGGVRLFLILVSLFLFTAIVSASDSSSGSAQGPPKTSVQPVEDTWHGHKIVDNYRWLEDGTTPQTKEWVKDELAYTRAMLDPLPGMAFLSETGDLQDVSAFVLSPAQIRAGLTLFVQSDVEPVPEATSGLLLAFGMFGLWLARRRLSSGTG